MRRCAKFRVLGRFEMASRASVGTVTIDRTSETFSVRQLRHRRVFTVSLSAVAEYVVRSLLQAEAREKAAAKRARKGRR